MKHITVMFFLLHWNEAKVVVFGRLIEFSMSSYLRKKESAKRADKFVFLMTAFLNQKSGMIP